MKTLLCTILLFILSNVCYGYVYSLDNNGKQIKWNSNITSISYFINTENNNGLNSNTILSIFNSSLNQWNNDLEINLEVYNTSDSPSFNRNDIYFSNSDLYFSGGGIVGLTMVAYDESSGDIVETDIILNENLDLSTRQTDDYYIGDVLSHEIGHTLGLSHSENQFATMFFKLTNGQDTIETDDKSGAMSIYNENPMSSIEGKIVGKDSSTGIFGTHVSAISLNNAEVVASVLSDVDGNFKISGLDPDDEYYIYTKPTELKDHIPSYYFAANSNFCLNNKSYVGSFYNSCLNKDEGYPKAINIDGSTSVNVGNISIRCTLDSPPRYLLSKGGGVFDLPMEDSQYDNSYGNSFVGFFTLNELINSSKDNLKIDLSNIDIPVSTNYLEEYFLELKIVSQPFYSKIKTEIEVEFFDYSSSVYPSALEVNSDGNPILDYSFRLPLESGMNSENIFNLEISANSVEDIFLTGIDADNDGDDDQISGYYSSTSYSLDEFFPESDLFSEKRYFYFVIANLVKRDSSNNYTKYYTRKYISSDNSECIDAPNSVNLNSLSSKTIDTEESEEIDSQAMACGSIDINNNNNGGGAAMSLILGFLLISLSSKRLFKKPLCFV